MFHPDQRYDVRLLQQQVRAARTTPVMKRYLDDFVLLSEEELAEGVELALRTTHNLAEGAGAAPLMAAMKLRDRLAGKKVVAVMSGGNIDRATLNRVIG